jgi:dipeptidase
MEKSIIFVSNQKMKKMRKYFFALLLTFIVGFVGLQNANACTNFLVTKGATVDGSTFISYAADSHVLYGELYYYPASDHPEGSMLKVYDWDSGKYLGEIPQVPHTYTVVGNMNEFQVAIGETTYGGRKELHHQPGAIMDYGSMIYIALQRAKTAREAIKVMTDLANKYGYVSEGESFSIADPNEVWYMELIGKGEGEKGAVWVALRVPDGYVSAHANQARITTFPYQKVNKWDDPNATCFNSPDVIEFARKKGWFKGKDKDFSFSDVYAPVDFGGARFCEARVWSMFRKVADGMDKYKNYAMGFDLKHRMPLWVKPRKKLTVRDIMEVMRDHFEGTDMDMTKDVGAGPFHCPYRWRPLVWKVDGKEYFNERAVSTQQTGFSFVAQMRSWLPREIGGIIWFGVDDTYSTVYTPIYTSITKVPHTYEVGNGSMMEWSDDAAFWVFNQVSNFAYLRYDYIIPEIRKEQQKLEGKFVNYVKAIDEGALKLYKKDKKTAIDFLTKFSCENADHLVYHWRDFYHYLFMKYMDGNIKEKSEPKEGYKYVTPKLKQPGYGEEWYRRIVKETGDKFLYRENEKK